MEEVNELKTYEVLIDFRFSVKDSGIVDQGDAEDFVYEYVSAAVPKINNLNVQSYNLSYEPNEDYACERLWIVFIRASSYIQCTVPEGGFLRNELNHYIESELFPELEDLFFGASNGDLTQDILQVVETYDISNYN